MSTANARLGFGDTRKAAEVSGLPQREVTRHAKSGEWKSWLIEGRRVFDLDDIAHWRAHEDEDRR
jgi:hypothetical protein